ncbi:MAG: hypothetical protein QXV17_08940 [Candidatus Micrarchaeaceae archaeon]
MARRSMVWQVPARRGMVWQGRVGQGKVWQACKCMILAYHPSYLSGFDMP